MARIIALHIIQDLDIAGAQTVVMNYMRWLHDDPDIEIRVAVLGPNRHSAYSEECAAKGYKVDYYNYKPWTKFPVIRSVANWIRLNLLVRKAIKRNKPNIIHSHQTSIIPYVCLPFLFSGIKKRFHTLHSDPFAISNRHATWAKFAFNRCGIYPVCVTKQQADNAIKRYGIKRYSIIRNGLDTATYSTQIDVNSLKQELGIKEDAFIIGCVSRLSKIKNFDFLLTVFAAYSERHNDSLLIIVGDGEEKTHIIEFANTLGIHDKIMLLGQQGNVAKFYHLFDVFMLTSFFESSSIVTVEAQLAGGRCVVADSIPSDVVITDQVNRIPLDAPMDTWISAIDGKLAFETALTPASLFTKDGVIDALKRLYAKAI